MTCGMLSIMATGDRMVLKRLFVCCLIVPENVGCISGA